jgi:hypothetical protein
MAKWEYAYICYSAKHGVQTWLPTSSDGSTGYTEQIPHKGDPAAIIRQQVARLCGEGWEIFQVTTEVIPATGGGAYSRPAAPMENVYHFRRSS